MDAPTALPDRATLDALRAAIDADLPAYLADLERLVNIDCGSYTPDGVNVVGGWTAAFLAGLGGRVETRPDPAGRLGNTVVATFEGRPGGPRVLLIGHLDTVFDPGTAAARPFRMDDGIATGPGVTDMKSGLLAGLYALKAIIGGARRPAVRAAHVRRQPGRGDRLADLDAAHPRRSPRTSMRRSCSSAPAPTATSCRRARGSVDLRIDVNGRAAHAGVEPEKGRSAILEAARIVRDLHDLNGRWPGVTVNVGVIAGGTRPNVVAERCRSRSTSAASARAELEAAEAEIRRIAEATDVPDTTVEVDARWRAGGRWRSSPGAAASSSTREAVAAALGFELGDASTGGASDANTTSGMGIPSLDGLGPIGGNDHAPGRVPRRRLDRAADDAARRAAARDRRRPGGPRLAATEAAA